MSKDPTDTTTDSSVDEMPRLLTTAELANLLSIPIATLYAWRYHGKGPTAIAVGNHLRYRREEVEAWLAESERKQGRRK